MSLSDEALLTGLAEMDRALFPAPPVDTQALADAALADLRAWTIRQPWASAIVGRPGGTGGPKNVENRTQQVKRRGLVLIHAGLKYDHARPQAPAVMGRWLGSDDAPREQAFGAIVGAAVITGCHFASGRACDGLCSPWAEPGVWHVKLGRRFAFETPVPASGALGFWKVTGDVRDAALRQLEAVAR